MNNLIGKCVKEMSKQLTKEELNSQQKNKKNVYFHKYKM